MTFSIDNELSPEMERWTRWQRNVIDEFKDLSNDEIKNILRETAFPYAVCFQNVFGDFNMASAARNANAFNAKEIFYLGKKRFDKRALCGAHNYNPVQYLNNLDEFAALKDRYTLIAVDNLPGSVSITNFEYPKNPLFVFGEEGEGLTEDIRNLCSQMIYIEQFGSIRSINVATASGIIMNDFVTKNRK